MQSSLNIEVVASTENDDRIIKRVTRNASSSATKDSIKMLISKFDLCSAPCRSLTLDSTCMRVNRHILAPLEYTRIYGFFFKCVRRWCLLTTMNSLPKGRVSVKTYLIERAYKNQTKKAFGLHVVQAVVHMNGK